MSEVKNVFKKLIAVQAEVNIGKDSYNSFANCKYRKYESILNFVKPIVAKNECALWLTDRLITDAGVPYIEATAHFVDAESGEEITANGYAREREADGSKMSVDQCSLAASSYARKKSLEGLFLIGSNEDSEENEDTNKQFNGKPTNGYSKDGYNNNQDYSGNAPAAKQGWGNKNQPAASASGNGWGKSATNSQPAPTAQQGWGSKSKPATNTQQKQKWNGNGKSTSASAAPSAGSYYDDIPLPEEPPRFASRQSA